MKLTDEDQEWLRSRGPTGHEADVAAAIARGYERGRGEADAERDALLAWRCDVTVALGRPQGTFYADVPNLIREVVADRDRLAKRCEELDDELTQWQFSEVPPARLSVVESRLAATDARLTALIEIEMDWATDALSPEMARARLAALRTPGVELRQCPECDCDPAALATARRERDEAVGVVSAWLDYRDRKGIADNARDPGLAAAIRRARALVAGQGAPGPRDAEIAGWRESAKALTGEIATLRAYLAEAQGEVTNERAKRIAAEHATGDTEEALLRVERDRDALRARIAELEAREKSARWLLATAHITKSLTPLDWHSKRETWLAGGHATPPDPARPLIERAVASVSCAPCSCDGVGVCIRCVLAADLRAYLGGGT